MSREPLYVTPSGDTLLLSSVLSVCFRPGEEKTSFWGRKTKKYPTVLIRTTGDYDTIITVAGGDVAAANTEARAVRDTIIAAVNAAREKAP